MALNEKKLTFETHEVAIKDPETGLWKQLNEKPEWMLKLNPLGKVGQHISSRSTTTCGDWCKTACSVREPHLILLVQAKVLPFVLFVFNKIAFEHKGINTQKFRFFSFRGTVIYLQVPILAYRDANERLTTVYESLICNEFLEDYAPHPEYPPLFPLHPGEKATARLIIDRFDRKFIPNFYGILVR